MATMNISLPDSLKAFVEVQVAEGGYSTASEYFRDLLRQAQKQRVQERLEALLLEGVENGQAKEMTASDWEDVRKQLREHLEERAG